jgi:hypothetical protein
MAKPLTIEDLNAKIEILSKTVEDLTRNYEKSNDSLSKTDNLFTDINNTINNIVSNNINFVTNLNRQYDLAESLAESYKQTSVNIGISSKRQDEFGKTFNKSVAAVQEFGGDMQDVKTAYNTFADESGRVRIMSPDEITNIVALEKGTNLVGDSASKLMEKFDLMGVSSENAMKSINQIFVDSQKIGLNASKVVKTLSDNFDTMQRYSFRNGVAGMTEMAKLSVKMRTNISDILGMAEKFYDPESAIETAANLQMLGGDIAAAFGDPIEMMYLARNEPEKLATKLQSITENMMTFNEVTKEYEFPPEVRMQLKAAGDQLGFNTDQIIDMARQTSKIKDIKMKVSSNITDDDMREQIASMAKMKDGKWVIDTKDGELSIDSDKLTKDLVSELTKVPKTQEEAILNTAKEALTTNQYLKSIDDKFKTTFVSEANIYNAVEKGLGPGINSMFTGMQNLLSTSLKGVSDNGVMDIASKMVGKIGDSVGELISEKSTNLTTQFESLLKNMDINEIQKIIATNVNLYQTGVPTTPSPTIPKKNDFLSPPMGERMISGPEGNFKINDNDLIIGGTNLFDNKKTNTATNLSGTLVIDMPSTITVNVAGDSKNVDLTDSNLKNIILKYVETSLRDGVDNSKVSGSGIYTTPGNQSFK